MRFKIKEKVITTKCHCGHKVKEKRYDVIDTKKLPRHIASYMTHCEADHLVKHLTRCPNEKPDFLRREGNE